MGLLDRLVAGIFRQEGMSPDSTNPGNVRDPVWFPGQPPIVSKVTGEIVSQRKYHDGAPVAYKLQGESQYFWVPRSRAEGVAAVYCQLAIHVREGDTLREFIGGSAHYPGYAPKSDANDPDVYVKNLSAWCSVDPDVPMWMLLNPSLGITS